MNYYPFNVGDYAAHTAHLEPMEDLAYRRLLDQYYLREGPLPADIQATAKLVRMRSMAADVESVLREFFTLTDEGWRHTRCDAEVEKMQDKQAKARASAAASVNARQAKQKPPAERPLVTEEATVERPLPVSSTDVKLPTPTPTPVSLPGVTGGKPPKPPKVDIALPGWLPEPQWSDFVQMRRAKGKRAPFTVAAAKGILADLSKLRDEGHSPAEVLQQSVNAGWSAVYPVKAGGPQGGGRTVPQRDDWTETAT